MGERGVLWETEEGPAVLWGDEGDEADIKEAFLQEIMHKLGAEAPMGGIQRVGREDGLDGRGEGSTGRTHVRKPAGWAVRRRAAQDGWSMPSETRWGRGARRQIVMDPADLVKETGPCGAGEASGSLSREDATQISPFAHHSGYGVDSRFKVGKRDPGKPVGG